MKRINSFKQIAEGVYYQSFPKCRLLVLFQPSQIGPSEHDVSDCPATSKNCSTETTDGHCRSSSKVNWWVALKHQWITIVDVANNHSTVNVVQKQHHACKIQIS